MEVYYVIGNIPSGAKAGVECPSTCAFVELCWRLFEEEPYVFPWLCLTETLEESIRKVPAEVWSIHKFFDSYFQIVRQFANVTG